MDATAAPTLKQLVEEQQTRKAIASVALDTPFVVHCGEAAPAKSWGYETQAVVAGWDTQVALAVLHYKQGELNPELLSRAGGVYPIVKRPGGPFPDRIGVGRARTSDVSLPLGSISKYHAFFTVSGRDDVSITDARSRNGTWVAGVKLAEGGSTKVKNGTHIVMGGVDLLFFTAEGLRELVRDLAKK